MNRLLLLLLLLAGIAEAQKSRFENVEMKGEVIRIDPGLSFAFSNLILKTTNDTSYLRFAPEYGEFMTKNLKPGLTVEVKAKIFVMVNKIKKEMRSFYLFDELLAIKIENNWIPMDAYNTTYRIDASEWESKIFLEKKVKGDFVINDRRVALFFGHGLVSFNSFNTKTYYPMKNIKIGDVVSFIGYRLPKKEGYVYPKPDNRNVFTFLKLTKAEGTVKSYLVKQNYVYIGLVLTVANREIPVAFPSDRAKEIKQFAEDHLDVIAYYSDFAKESITDPPELHALVNGPDTLKIEKFGFTGGADVNHDHKEAEIEGKVTSVNRSDNGRIMSVIIGNEFYIEVDNNIEKNLGNYLRRGTLMKINGEERIKKEGEIYSKSYRIITPQKITVDGKEFQLNTLPR